MFFWAHYIRLKLQWYIITDNLKGSIEADSFFVPLEFEVKF